MCLCASIRIWAYMDCMWFLCVHVMIYVYIPSTYIHPLKLCWAMLRYGSIYEVCELRKSLKKLHRFSIRLCDVCGISSMFSVSPKNDGLTSYCQGWCSGGDDGVRWWLSQQSPKVQMREIWQLICIDGELESTFDKSVFAFIGIDCCRLLGKYFYKWLG